MKYDEIPRASDELYLYNKQIAKMVTDRVNYSREESMSLRRNVNKWYDLWRGYIRARTQPFRNQVHLPMLFSGIEAGVAIKHGLLFGQSPYVEFVPSGVEDAPQSRRTTALIQQQFEDADLNTKAATILRMGDITGSAPYQWSWRLVKNVRPQRVPLGIADPAMPMGQAYQVITQEMTDFDGPWIEPLDLLDWFPEPGRASVKELRWCIRRYFIDLDDLRQLAAEGLFDADAVEEISTTQMTDEKSSEFENRRTAPGGVRWTTSSVGLIDKYSKPVEILEHHGYVPEELVPADGLRNRLITIGNGVATLRNVGNPIWSGGIPFGLYSPTPDPYSLYGIGKVEPNDKLQATASRLMSQKLDAMDMVIDPMFAYDRLANVATDKLYARAGGLVGGDGPPANWLQAIFPDLRGLQQGTMEIEAIWRWMQHGTGMSEEAIGMTGEVGSDRQTAREFLGKMENVQRRMVREALHAANVILLPLAEAFRAMDSQFLSFPRVLRMLGQSALIDPRTGMPIPPDNEVGLEDVTLRYDMRAASAASLIGRSAKQQNWLLLLQALGPPMANPILNWQSVYRETFRVFEHQHPDEFMMPMSPLQVLAMQMASMTSQMGGEQGGGSEEKGKGKVSGAPGTVNSDIMDQMVSPDQSAELGSLGLQ